MSAIEVKCSKCYVEAVVGELSMMDAGPEYAIRFAIGTANQDDVFLEAEHDGVAAV